MASTRDIKKRKASIQSTQQITKAMKLVSTVKLQHARGRAERSRSYFDCMYSTVQSILEKTKGVRHPYLDGNDSPRKAVMVITSNRGLAGGYNSNIVKLITKGEMPKEELDIYAIGTKGRDALSRAGYQIRKAYPDLGETPSYTEAMALTELLLESYTAGEVGEIYLAYTAFKNTVTHEARLIRLLPVEPVQEPEKGASALMNFEPEETEALNLLIPKYLSSLIYGGLVESVASENGARMQAMDSATSNAQDMIQDLELLYNRARQGAITTELTEIIAGAEALN
ncbi:MAG: ATP synthase F1 subunit gamma [Lachnospiraceae bacterium]|nr:ATP synthase F1 subunit gamma [Lachnospiraceae bacterium]